MSASNGIDFVFSENQDPSQVLRFLLANGWSLDVCGKVKYVVPANIRSDDFEWRDEPIESFDYETYLEESRKQKCLCLQMVGSGEEYGADFRIMETGGRLNIWDTIIALPGNSRIADFSWYLRKLSAMFREFKVHELKCSYSN